MDVLDLTYYDIGFWFVPLELSPGDDGEPLERLFRNSLAEIATHLNALHSRAKWSI
jgi:hypothetical protein